MKSPKQGNVGELYHLGCEWVECYKWLENAVKSDMRTVGVCDGIGIRLGAGT